MLRKAIGILMLFLLLAFLLTGCTQKKVMDLTPEEGYIVVTDYLGKQVKIKQNPNHIGSIFAVSSHVIAMFGDVEKIVAISEGNTRDFLFCEIYPQILNARIVKGNNALNIEEVVKKPRPEVLIVNPEVALEGSRIKQLEKLNIPIVTIAYDNVEQQQTIELLGKITVREKEAASYNEYYRHVVDLVTSRTAGIPEDKRKTVYHAINELLRTDQANTLSTDWISKIGVKNVALAG